MFHFLRAVLTVVRLRSAALELGDVKVEHVDAFIRSALKHATPHAPVELLVALGWPESRFDPHAGPACGVLQVYPNDLDLPWQLCAVWARDVDAGMAAGVLEIETLLRDHRVHGDLWLALDYRACGNSAFVGGCGKEAWIAGVLTRRDRIVDVMRGPRPRV